MPQRRTIEHWTNSQPQKVAMPVAKPRSINTACLAVKLSPSFTTFSSASSHPNLLPTRAHSIFAVFALYAATTFLLVSSRVPLHPADTEDVLVFKYEGEYCKLGSHQRFKKVSKSCR